MHGTPQRRPHILFICTDQQRYDTLGAYGNEHARTPVLDALAENGVVFDNCYVQNPVCAPSRASLMTGRYVAAHGLHANGVALPEGNRLFMKNLADAGYDCALFGKQHLSSCFGGRDEIRQDDGYRVYRHSHDPRHPSPENAYHQWLRREHPALYAAAEEGTGSFDDMPTEAHYSHWVAEEAIDYVRAGREPDKPFFAWVNFYDPHHDFVAPPEYLDRFDPAALPSPVGSPADLADRPAVLTEASVKSYAGHLPGFQDYDEAGIRDIVHNYYAMVALIDDEVGRILAALDEAGLADDTLVVFTSDHGENLGDHGLLLKGPMFYEGAVRVPLVMRWPAGLPAGERRAGLVQWIDLNATLTDAAGVPPLPRAQGTSLLPTARGEADGVRDWALCEYRDSGHPYADPCHATMLRTGVHKLVVHHGAPVSGRARDGELYDLAADPREMTNLWHDAGSRELRAGLEAYLMDVLVAVQDRTQPRDGHW
ncbi:sulfatase-like hydrolase/transferase [Streptomyces sp. WMMC500]|uniref:sulfatase family protein n=1 Tax=Streptomyces sp. WMMC500 TaxID=3015154 RepID=UPI00248C9AF9|nr:sulfatase-like hydrolase/transferase [Streptomyces sp. WMMC500]WBB58510.1 sulfatase-like hydrolase/transferase [Streptomyces sp. WMMC500]